jgi:hypothetical protein
MSCPLEGKDIRLSRVHNRKRAHHEGFAARFAERDARTIECVDKKILVTFQLGSELLRAILCNDDDLRFTLSDTFLCVMLAEYDISGFYGPA